MMGLFRTAVLLLSICIAATAALSMSGLPGTPLAVTTEECHWVCASYGVFMECADDELVVGACGAKSWANCENKAYCPGQNNIYAAIQCCKLSIEVSSSDLP